MNNKLESEKYGGKASEPIEDQVVSPKGSPVAELEAKLQEAEAELAGYRSVEDITQFELRELREKLAKAEAGISNADFDSLRQQLEAKDAEIERLRTAPAQSEGGQLKDSQASYFVSQLEAARTTIATLEQELLKEPEVDVAAYEALKSEAAVLKADIGVLASKLSSNEDTLADLRRENASLDERLLDSLTQLTSIRAMRNDYETEMQGLKAELAQAKNDSGMVEELKAQLTQARFEVEAYGELQKAKEDAQHRAAMLEGELSELKAQMQDYTELKQRIAQAETAVFEAAQLRSNLKRVRFALADALSQVDGLVDGAEARIEADTQLAG